jgi:hypothetical protein
LEKHLEKPCQRAPGLNDPWIEDSKLVRVCLGISGLKWNEGNESIKGEIRFILIPIPSFYLNSTSILYYSNKTSRRIKHI